MPNAVNSLTNRQIAIIELLQLNHTEGVEDMAAHFSVTPMSIRRDLIALEDKKLICRTRGYAHIANNQQVSSMEIRRQIKANEKELIAKEALKYISPNDSVILDSGTSVYALAVELAKKSDYYRNVSVVTNSLPAANILGGTLTTVVSGGFVDRNSLSMVGQQAEMCLKTIAVNKAFMGTTGLHMHAGLTTMSQMQMSIKRSMIEKSPEIYVLMDSYKFSATGANVFCGFDRISTIITVRNERSAEQIDILIRKGLRIKAITMEGE